MKPERHEQKSRNAFFLFIHSECGRWILSAFTALAIIGTVYLIVKPVFMTIDDARLLYVYAGYASGKPEMSYLFSYVPIGFLVSSLYKLAPAVPWYGIYHLATVFLASTIIGKTIYKIVDEKGIALPVGIAIHAFLYISLCLVSTIMMHFEITASMIGTAGVVLMLGIRPGKEKKSRTIIDIALAVFCVAFCFCIQFNSFYSVCCFLLVAVVYQLFRAVTEKNLKKTLISLGCFVLCLAISCGGIKLWENQSKSSPKWKQYLSYNEYRVSFWDYPHISYRDDPELFEQIGWTENFYNLTENMYFMDERFNEEALASFTTRFSWTKLGSVEELKNNFVKSVSNLYKDKIVKQQFWTIALLILLMLIKLLLQSTWKKKRWPATLAALCCSLGTAFVLAFLAMRGRFPLRAWLAIIIPFGMAMGILLIDKPRLNHNKVLIGVIGALCVAFLGFWGYNVYRTYDRVIKTDVDYRVKSNETVARLEEYAIAHQDRIIVFDNNSSGANYNVFTCYTKETGVPTNLIGWGSSYLYTPTYYRQLQICGKEKLLTQNLYNKGVYFATNQKKGNLSLLMKMLREDNPKASYTAVRKLSDNLMVFKINKKG